MLRSSGPGQVLGSSVANRVFAIRLVQWLGWVFETQERKKTLRHHALCAHTPTTNTVFLSFFLSWFLFVSKNSGFSRISLLGTCSNLAKFRNLQSHNQMKERMVIKHLLFRDISVEKNKRGRRGEGWRWGWPEIIKETNCLDRVSQNSAFSKLWGKE